MFTNINEYELKILDLFTKGFDKQYYVREVAKILKISSKTAFVVLNKLEDKTILKSTIRGKIKEFKLTGNFIAKQYLILTENYKLIRFLDDKLLIKEIIEKIIPELDVGVIFGSYVKDLEKSSSDLDILIIGNYNVERIKEIEKIYGIELNIKNYSKDIFKDRKNSDFLLKEVLKNHVIFKGGEFIVSEVMGSESDQMV